jgi:hypothetical protein
VRLGHLARPDAGGQQHDVGDVDRGAAGVQRHLDLALADQPALARDDGDAGLDQRLADVHRLRLGQRLDPAVDLLQVHPGHTGTTGLHASTVPLTARGNEDPELVGTLEGGHDLGGRDQRLGGNAVGEHRGAPEPVGVDEEDLGPESGGHQCRLISARSATDDHDPLHVLHCPSRNPLGSTR